MQGLEVPRYLESSYVLPDKNSPWLITNHLITPFPGHISNFSLERKETLFAGYFDKTLNGTLPSKAKTCSCNKHHDKRSSLIHENIEDIAENFEVMDCYAEDLVCFQQQNSQPFLTKAFALGKSPDFKHFTDLIVQPTKVNVESDESVIEQKEVAQIILSTSAQSSHTGTPPEGMLQQTLCSRPQSLAILSKFAYFDLAIHSSQSYLARKCTPIPERQVSIMVGHFWLFYKFFLVTTQEAKTRPWLRLKIAPRLFGGPDRLTESKLVFVNQRDNCLW